MKSQDKIRAKELNEMEIINMPDKELEVIVIKVLTGFEKRVDKLSESFN